MNDMKWHEMNGMNDTKDLKTSQCVTKVLMMVPKQKMLDYLALYNVVRVAASSFDVMAIFIIIIYMGVFAIFVKVC